MIDTVQHNPQTDHERQAWQPHIDEAAREYGLSPEAAEKLNGMVSVLVDNIHEGRISDEPSDRARMWKFMLDADNKHAEDLRADLTHDLVHFVGATGHVVHEHLLNESDMHHLAQLDSEQRSPMETALEAAERKVRRGHVDPDGKLEAGDTALETEEEARERLGSDRDPVMMETRIRFRNAMGGRAIDQRELANFVNFKELQDRSPEKANDFVMGLYQKGEPFPKHHAMHALEEEWNAIKNQVLGRPAEIS